jgi:DNA repair exonuclease SbcCD nuclease subunit
MRFLLYSDLQLHPYKEFASYENGVNSRLLDHINVLEQILEYALLHQIQYIFFGGDMFEARARVDVIAAKLLAEWKWKVSKAGITQVDIVGNHDLVDKSSTHNAIELYRKIPDQYIITEAQWFKDVYCVPYMHRLEDILEAVNEVRVGDTKANVAAIVHYGMYDVPTESYSIIRDLGYDTEGQVRVSDLDYMEKWFRFVFFGHFHVTHAITPKIHFIGTPLQHKWGERHVETRFLDVDLDKGHFEAIKTIAPRFVEFEDVKFITPEACVGNFCRVKVTDFDSRADAVKQLLTCGAKGADAIVVKQQTEVASRLGLNLSMSFEEMGSAMVNADTDTKLDKVKLKQVLADALKTAATRMNT